MNIGNNQFGTNPQNSISYGNVCATGVTISNIGSTPYSAYYDRSHEQDLENENKKLKQELDDIKAEVAGLRKILY